MQILLIISVALIAYVYVGYPLALWLIEALRGRSGPTCVSHQPAAVQRISVLVAAHDEEANIAAKIRNLLALDYSKERLELIIGDDCSADRTAEIVGQFADKGVQLIGLSKHGGKSAIQNRMAESASGEILVFTDADCLVNPEALQLLVQDFADPRVGLVTARVRYANHDETAITQHESQYLRYDTWIRARESSLGILAVASGSFFAIRKSLWRPLDENLGDDFVCPLRVIEAGMRNILDARIIASTHLSQDSPKRFVGMKARIITRDFGALLAHRGVLNPARYGFAAIGLWSHKLLRWLVPYFLLTSLLTSLCLPWRSGCAFLLLQIAFYTAAAAALLDAGRGQKKVLRLPLTFCLVNFAALQGTLNWCFGRTRAAWRTQRGTAPIAEDESRSPGALS
jgi:cellulose synthase/poly-beta-1,6-N-acetylglucosamine synthase-like glycosyltransferase